MLLQGLMGYASFRSARVKEPSRKLADAEMRKAAPMEKAPPNKKAPPKEKAKPTLKQRTKTRIRTRTTNKTTRITPESPGGHSLHEEVEGMGEGK